jgi:hypothetical protein
MSIERINFRFNWSFCPKAIGKRSINDKVYCLDSPIFATSHNNVVYSWIVSIQQYRAVAATLDNGEAQQYPIFPFLLYRNGPKKEIECVTTFRITDKNGLNVEGKMKSSQFIEGKGWALTDNKFQSAFDLQYRSSIGINHIELVVDLSLSADLFDPIILLPLLPTAKNSSLTINENMLANVLAGAQQLKNYCVKIMCNGGEFFVDPHFFINASDYFKSFFSFDEMVKNEKKSIDFSYIAKERMIMVRYFYEIIPFY